MELGLYAIKRDPRSNDWMVYLKRTGKAYFYSESKSECREWIERNDGDEQN